MGLKRTDEFRKDAVRIALASGLTIAEYVYDAQSAKLRLRGWLSRAFAEHHYQKKRPNAARKSVKNHLHFCLPA